MQFLCLVLRVVALLSWPNLSLFWKMEKAERLLSAAAALTSSRLRSKTLFFFKKRLENGKGG